MSVSRLRSLMLPLMVVALLFGAVACGSDDDADVIEDAQANDDAVALILEYCEYSAGLSELEGAPTEEQFAELAALAPAEIAEQVELVAAAIVEKGEAAFMDENDEAFHEALDAIEAFEEANCAQGDDAGDADSADGADEGESDDSAEVTVEDHGDDEH